MSRELIQKKVSKQSTKKPITRKGTSSNQLMNTTLMQEKKDSIKDIEKVNRLNTQYSKKPPYSGWPYKKELSALWKVKDKNKFASKVQGIQKDDLGFSGKSSDGILGRGTAKKMLKTKEESIHNTSNFSENVIHVEIDELSKDLDTSDVDSYKEEDLFIGKPLSGIHDGLKRNLKVFAIKYKKDKKKKLKINSAYRSIAHQKRLYDRNKKKNGGKPNGMVASPGSSMHQYGMAVDIGGIKSVKESLLNKYGLHRPVHKGSKSKTWEHWHVEPMGIDRKGIRTQGKKNFKKFGTAGMSKKNALGSEKVAILSLHADIDTADFGISDLMNGSVGHTWVSLNWKDSSMLPPRVLKKYSKHAKFLKGGSSPFGFWPRMFESYSEATGWTNLSAADRASYSTNPFESYVKGQVVHPDILHSPKATQHYEITEDEAINVMDYARSKQSADYSVYFFNCTTFAANVVKSAGKTAPSSSIGNIAYPNRLYASIKQNQKNKKGHTVMYDDKNIATEVQGSSVNVK